MTAPNFLHGSPREIMADFDTANGASTYTFAVGELVYLDSNGKVYPCGTDTTTISGFLGAAAQKKAAGTTGTAKRLFGNSRDGKIRVDPDGIVEYDRSDTIALTTGDLMQMDGTTANTLKKASSETNSIARVETAVAAGVSRVRVKIMSRKFPAGPIS